MIITPRTVGAVVPAGSMSGGPADAAAQRPAGGRR